MARSMTRGKQRVLLNHLPGQTFDFERGPIAQVTGIRGTLVTDLNEEIVIRKLSDRAKAWHQEHRPALGDHVLNDASKFVLLDPEEVQANMYPRVFWCQNSECGVIIDATSREQIPSSNCPRCKSGKLVQFRFVRVHRCGAIAPLIPTSCPNCHGRDIALNTRGSERLAEFRWVCMKCHHRYRPFGGVCHACNWPDGGKDKNMQIEVHRAGRTFYAQNAVLLNIPSNELEGLLSHPHSHCVIAAKFLGLPSVDEVKLADFFKVDRDTGTISTEDIGSLLDDSESSEKAIEKLRRMIDAKKGSPNRKVENICTQVTTASGLPEPVWKNASADLLECIIPYEGTAPTLLSRMEGEEPTLNLAQRLGIGNVALVQDYTIVNATFGYTRVDYQPNQCWLNPFPPDRSYKGRLPIYVDKIQAEAILISLEPEMVLEWLSLNGFTPNLPKGSTPANAAKAYFVQLFDGASLYQTIEVQQPELRMVFGLLHTLSHLCIRQASLLCGLEKTSISEYLLPRSLSVAIYCNHRFGAAIGALTALFQQSLSQWLTSIRETRNCVYDPVCHDHEGNCHACTHLAETSCRFFNLNLSRSFLFGGPDRMLGQVRHGYCDIQRSP